MTSLSLRHAGRACRRSGIALAGVAGLVLMACTPSGSSSQAASPTAAGVSTPTKSVVAISIDGLNPSAITPDRTPALTRLKRYGAGTLNARAEVEQTVTLPNHTGMVTSRRIDASQGGHGVDWNDERQDPATVQEAAGHPVGSVFSVLNSNGRSAAVFASKEKFRIFDRSWDAGVDRFTRRTDNRELMTLAIRDIARQRRPFTFIHLSAPDVAGHAKGFMSPAYLQAVRTADAQVGRLLTALDNRPRLKADTTIVLTADHGGRGEGHSDPTRLDNYRVPFLVWGAGTAKGADLYALNPDFADPGTGRPSYSAPRQPVRNGMVADLSLDLLGLNAIVGSELDVAQNLDAR